jgi:hypothetical protein
MWGASRRHAEGMEKALRRHGNGIEKAWEGHGYAKEKVVWMVMKNGGCTIWTELGMAVGNGWGLIVAEGTATGTYI